jgi:predicted  nucleic acid-binding Zn-ribbon protein
MTYGEVGNPHDACRERIGELEQELARVTAAYQQYVDGVETAEGRRIAELEREVERLREELKEATKKLVGWPDTMMRMIDDFYRDDEQAAAAAKEQG